MKFTINTPQNPYAGWTGFLTDAAGKRHNVAAWDGQAAYETKAQLIAAARKKMRIIEAHRASVA